MTVAPRVRLLSHASESIVVVVGYPFIIHEPLLRISVDATCRSFHSIPRLAGLKLLLHLSKWLSNGTKYIDYPE
jgi:hypothetical protein